MKVCNKCKEKKELSEFSRKHCNKDGYNFTCKKCQTEYKKGKYIPVKSKWEYVF